MELWLAVVETAGDGAAHATHEGHVTPAAADEGAEWDVRLAQVATASPQRIMLLTGSWPLPGAAETGAGGGTPRLRAAVRRFDADGLAEWEGDVEATGGIGSAEDMGADGMGLEAMLAHGYAQPGGEAAIVIRLAPGTGTGRLFQRRRSPRLALGLTPVRLRPPAAEPDLLPVARLTDVSATGAGVVVDEPLSAGTAVTLEFELPGAATPFAVRGRVVEPAVPIHGESQPQPDGLPGFRRGIEFTGTGANREARRLTATLERLLPGDR